MTTESPAVVDELENENRESLKSESDILGTPPATDEKPEANEETTKETEDVKKDDGEEDNKEEDQKDEDKNQLGESVNKTENNEAPESETSSAGKLNTRFAV